MKAKVLLCSVFILFSWALAAQDTSLVRIDTLPVNNLQIDTLRSDSTQVPASLSVSLSANALDASVTYNGQDSMIMDVTGTKIHLYGNAFVSYQDITLKAAHIELDWTRSIVEAEGMLSDSTGRIEGKPEFTEGENTFGAGRMRYNFETRKGIVYDALTQENDVLVRGERSKLIMAPPSDTTAQDIIYSENAIFTTCTADHPHFGIRSRKQKIIPNKAVIIGPSNLEIMGVPTPLWLPFGAFPLKNNRSTGLIFPNNYQYSDQWGFGFENFGWFFPLGDHVNLSLTGTYYLQGTFGLGAQVDYNYRYRFRGNVNLDYDNRVNEILIDNDNGGQTPFQQRTKSFSLRLTHNQDAAAHPMNRFGGSINFQTNGFQNRVYNDPRSVGTNVINSNFSFSRTWTDKPISMSAAFTHSQNTRTRIMDVNFPTFNFQTQTLYPFRRKSRTGRAKWYEDITLRYTNEAKANFTATDTTFFRTETLENARYGMRQNATSGTSFKLFKYFNLNPSVNYSEVWSLRSIRDARFSATDIEQDTTVLPDGSLQFDTTDYGTYIIDDFRGLSTFRTFSASVSLNTQLFSTIRLAKGPVRGLRYVMKPSIAFGYEPDYLDAYFYQLQDTLNPERIVTLPEFQSAYSIYGSPPQSGQRMAMSYSITNIFEAKLFSRRDSTERNLKLFDNIYVGGNYNFAADSMRWSAVSVSGTTRLFKGATNFSFNATFDPLVNAVDPNTGFRRRYDITVWQDRRRPVEFQNATFRMNTNLTVGKIRAIFQGKEEEVVEEVDINGNAQQDRRPNDIQTVAEEDFLSLVENFSIRHNVEFRVQPISTADRDTFLMSAHSIELRGNLQLTPNWGLNFGSIGYDFISKRTTYPYLGITRDLHCWEASFNWAPTRNTYNFIIRVKPGSLDFLKIPYDRNNVDGAAVFR